MFSFGEVGKECHVKSVLRVHDPMFYWKVLFSLLTFWPTTFAGSYLSRHWKYILQVATEADLGLADAYINGYFSFVDKRDGLLNLFLVRYYNLDSKVKQLAHVFFLEGSNWYMCIETGPNYLYINGVLSCLLLDYIHATDSHCKQGRKQE